MCFTSLIGQTKWIVVLVTVDARTFKVMTFCMFNLRLGLPVKTGRVLKPIGPYIANTGLCLLYQVSFAMGRQMAVHTMYIYAMGVIMVGGEFPALSRVGMYVTRGAKFIAGGCGYCFVC